MNYIFLAWVLLGAPLACRAQTGPPATYKFLTLLESESQANDFSKILFAPAFQGKTEVPLERLPGTTSSSRYMAARRQNSEAVNRQLEAITAAGWELVHVSADERAHEYLFRRRKP
jgi:hypothetical protein